MLTHILTFIWLTKTGPSQKAFVSPVAVSLHPKASSTSLSTANMQGIMLLANKIAVITDQLGGLGAEKGNRQTNQ